MRWGLMLALAIAGMSAVVIACGGASTTPVKTKSGGTKLATLSAQNKSFSRDSISVPAGAATVVLFQNNDSVEHTFTVFTGEDTSGEIVADSGPVKAGEAAEVTVLFGKPGKHAYRCQIYPEMQGTIIVE